MFYKIILLLKTVALKHKAPITVAFLICTLTVFSPLSLTQVYAADAYDSGYDHGCSDAGISDSSERYTNQPEKGPSYHTEEFNDGYDAGFSACSSGGSTSSNGGSNDDDAKSSNDDGEILNDVSQSSSSSGSQSSSSSGSQSSSSSGSQSGYQLTVNVPSHPFGKSSVSISITTENGHKDFKTISTAGDPSWTFNIPSNQGDTVEVCVDSGLISLRDCEKYSVVGGGNREVSLSAP